MQGRSDVVKGRGGQMTGQAFEQSSQGSAFKILNLGIGFSPCLNLLIYVVTSSNRFILNSVAIHSSVTLRVSDIRLIRL
jgi:hypothetical protein